MIPFTMKILNYKAGTFSVEYTPSEENCHSIKLNIKLDTSELQTEEAILEKLKLASPQDFWYDQIEAAESSRVNSIAEELINTTHQVQYVDSAAGLGRNRNIVPSSAYGVGSMINRSSRTGQSSPEFVAPVEDQNIIKLKVLIQQVLHEMAEGTV